jgi:hypothetical protein
VAQVLDYSLDLDSDKNEVGLAGWTKNTKVVGYLWVKR